MSKSRNRHRAAQKNFHQAPESMAALVEGMADDFNNILTTVMGACSLIDRDKAANVELLQCIELIRASAERAANLSGRLMRASTKELEAGVAINMARLSDKKNASARDKKTKNGIVSPNIYSGGATH